MIFIIIIIFFFLFFEFVIFHFDLIAFVIAKLAGFLNVYLTNYWFLLVLIFIKLYDKTNCEDKDKQNSAQQVII